MCKNQKQSVTRSQSRRAWNRHRTGRKPLWLKQSMRVIVLHVVLKMCKSQALRGACRPWSGLVLYFKSKKNSLWVLDKKLKPTSMRRTDWRETKLDEARLIKCRIIDDADTMMVLLLLLQLCLPYDLEKGERVGRRLPGLFWRGGNFCMSDTRWPKTTCRKPKLTLVYFILH